VFAILFPTLATRHTTRISNLYLLHKSRRKLLISELDACSVTVGAVLGAPAVLHTENLSGVGHIEKVPDIQLAKRNTKWGVYRGSS
jgi:hypothetical protein